MCLSFSIGGHYQVEGHPRKDLPACLLTNLYKQKTKTGHKKSTDLKRTLTGRKKVLEYNMVNKNQTVYHR